MKGSLARYASAIVCVLFAKLGTAAAQEGENPNSLIIYAGASTWRYFGDSLDFKFSNTGLVAAAVDHTLYSFDFGLNIETEAGIGRRFGKDNLFELWGAVGIRWTRFPWNHTVTTTFGGMVTGLDYITKDSTEELHVNPRPTQLLNFFSPEITFALPEHPENQFVIRLHHRSGIFHLINDVDDSITFFTLGYRMPLG